MEQLKFFDLPDHLKRLSEAGDPLEEMARIIDFEACPLRRRWPMETAQKAGGRRMIRLLYLRS